MRKELAKRLLAIALSLVVGVTFIPLLGSSVYAEEEGSDPVDVVLDAGDVDEADVVTDGEEPGEEEAAEDVADVVPGESAGGEEDAAVEEGDVIDVEEGTDTDAADVPEVPAGTDPQKILAGLSATNLPEEDALSSSEYVTAMADADIFTWSCSVSGKTATVKGTIKSAYKNSYTFGGLYMDGKDTSNYAVAVLSDSFTKKISMSDYDIGYHTLYALFFKTLDGSNIYDAIQYALDNDDYSNISFFWRAKKKVASKITSKPNYNGKFYYVYSKYFEYYPFNFGKNVSNPTGTYLYMEYKTPKAKKWKRTGAMKWNSIELLMEQGFKITKGLVPNKLYKTRLRYGTYVTYSKDIGGDGKTYFFGGPVRKTKTIKTGAKKKPMIKSVKVKAVKVKRHKVKHYGYYTGVYLYTEKYYTYKVKVTVNLKKKPGTKGLWINGIFVKGNKKKYTVTLPGSSYSSKKPKGKKYKVNICSYQGKSFGGLSPLYKKTKKIK